MMADMLKEIMRNHPTTPMYFSYDYSNPGNVRAVMPIEVRQTKSDEWMLIGTELTDGDKIKSFKISGITFESKECLREEIKAPKKRRLLSVREVTVSRKLF